MNINYKKITPYIIVLLIGMLIGGSLVTYAYNIYQKNLLTLTNNLPNLTPPPKQPLSAARNTPVVKVAQTVGPAVVGITNKALARDWYNNKVLVDQGTGSGVIIDPNGYIITNNHVIANAQEILVSLADGRVLAGKVLGADPATDLAVVKVEDTNLPSATLGDSDASVVGEPVIAIGNPLGLEFQGSVTTGVISALNRSIEIGERRFSLLQTDAAINPGNSGGALVNADGQVIGINSAKIALEGVEGIGLAIPINTVRPIVESLIAKGRVVRAYLGIGIVDKNIATKQGYQVNFDSGVLIVKVAPNAPAGKAGLQEGDIILNIANLPTNNVAQLREALDSQNVGSVVNVEINRQGKNKIVAVTLEEMPAE